MPTQVYMVEKLTGYTFMFSISLVAFYSLRKMLMPKIVVQVKDLAITSRWSRKV